ncbi:hypothetical protein Verru16b_01608 [Lacunisphaera limnophila]|uniref:Glycosyltransferase RgtA/B/C/D-like domain-containing protein n=1 Tax=Lacunisphaera limnophila TaxID=1838286 RepID=A0A1D8AUI8_9BACT|nr:hypothetical protein [Lacunisphaera limnophila]AOS44545.1 hypothetical protein Verru16b_01608 [Lacunisphaera limnophila]
MLGLLIRDHLLFLAAITGLGVPWLTLLRRWPAPERLALAVGAALLTGWLVGFGLYTAGVPLRWFWLAPALGTALALAGPQAIRALLADAAVRRLAGQWALLAVWCLGWQMLVVNYSGAAWQRDWFEHYDRAHFFLARWPQDFLFLNVYPLPARPPLVNVWSAVLLGGSGGAFYHHQVFLTLLSSLVFLPLAVLAQAWHDDRRTSWRLLLVLMASPLLVQNATFPWTKLPAAFFVLLAWGQLCPRPGAAEPGRLVAAALALAGGMLAHYSTGPWILALLAAWLATRRAELLRPGVRREVLAAVLLSALVFLPWVGWALAQYGLGTTFTQNTAVALAPQEGAGARLLSAGINLLNTLSPVSFVGLDHPLLQQSSPAGRWRDGWFILYQLRLWWAFGVTGGLALVWLLWHTPRGPGFRFSVIAVPTVVVLGIVTHAHPDWLGLVHISLQPLVLLGLAWLAAQAGGLPRGLQLLYGTGLTIDLTFGIGLHFALQSAWLGQAADVAALWTTLPLAAQVNWHDKLELGFVFLADQPHGISWGRALIGLSASLALWRGRAAARP